jgi:nucleotide-binding universal stress UspA family protein
MRSARSRQIIGAMSASIVVGHDPHGADAAPVQFGIAAARLTGAPLVVVAVHGGGHLTTRVADVELGPAAEDALAGVRAQLEAEPDIKSELRLMEARSAAHGLSDVLEEVTAGLGVVGATSRGAFGRSVVGSTAERVIHGAPCPVAVVPHGFAARELRTVGVAYTPSPEGEQALRSGVALARVSGAALRVITALHEDIGTLGSNLPGARAMQQIPEERASQHHIAQRDAVDAAIAETGGGIDAEVELVYGDPAEALLGFTGSLDLLVMGSRAYGPRRAVLLGGVSRRVTAAARCPVVVLPRGAPHPLRDLVAQSAA